MLGMWLITIVTFFIGYALAKYEKNPEPIKRGIRVIKRKIKGQRLGGIKNLTAEEMRKKGTRLEETEKAMEETLDNVL